MLNIALTNCCLGQIQDNKPRGKVESLRGNPTGTFVVFEHLLTFLFVLFS
jgi:hypothetical protein